MRPASAAGSLSMQGRASDQRRRSSVARVVCMNRSRSRTTLSLITSLESATAASRNACIGARFARRTDARALRYDVATPLAALAVAFQRGEVACMRIRPACLRRRSADGAARPARAAAARKGRIGPCRTVGGRVELRLSASRGARGQSARVTRLANRRWLLVGVLRGPCGAHPGQPLVLARRERVGAAARPGSREHRRARGKNESAHQSRSSMNRAPGTGFVVYGSIS